MNLFVGLFQSMAVFSFCIFILFSGSVVAQESDSGLDDWEVIPYGGVYDVCNFSQSDYAMIDTVIELFEMHAEEKVVNRLFTNNEYKALVRAYTSEFIDGLSLIEGNCTAGSWYADYSTMDDIVAGMVEYVTVLKLLQSVQSEQTTGNDLIAQHSLLLQKHLQKVFDQNPSVFNQFGLVLDVDFVSAESSTDQMLATLGVIIDGAGNNDASSMTMSMEVIGAFLGTIDGEELALGSSVNLEIIGVDDALYMQLKGVEFDTNMLDGFEEELELLRAVIDQLQGKWIEVPLDIEGDEYGFLPSIGDGGLGELDDLFSFFDLVDTPALKTYHRAGTMHFGGINPLVCQFFEGVVADCLAMRHEGYKASNGRGYIQLYSGIDTHSFGLTQQFIDENKVTTEEDGAFLFEKALVWWNSERVTRISLPENEMMQFEYEADSNGGFSVMFSLLIEELGTITVDMTGYEVPVAPISVNAPSVDQVISLDELLVLITSAFVKE